ncbi:hypothetical protein T439DRAFT_115983 [Meredithblackwellia eburnea MCA 4105]
MAKKRVDAARANETADLEIHSLPSYDLHLSRPPPFVLSLLVPSPLPSHRSTPPSELYPSLGSTLLALVPTGLLLVTENRRVGHSARLPRRALKRTRPLHRFNYHYWSNFWH